MTPNPDPQEEKVNQLARRVDEIRADLRTRDPYRLVSHVGGRFTPKGEAEGGFSLTLWGQPLLVTYPGFEVLRPENRTPLGVDIQALIAYHFQTSDGAPLASQWIAFSDLPGGRFYAQAYQTYSGAALVRKFGNDLPAFQAAAGRAGGEAMRFADAAYAFPALPRVWLLAAYWLGDEDFPSNAQVLFDASIPHHLPMDVCAILGGMLARRILRA